MKTPYNLVSKYDKIIKDLENDIKHANEYNDGTLENIEFIRSCMNDIMHLEDKIYYTGGNKNA